MFVHAPNFMVRLVLPAVILWVVDRLWRAWNRRRGFAAELSAVAGGTRVVARAMGAVSWKPGQWAYVSFGGVPGVGGWELHPFSLVAATAGAQRPAGPARSSIR